MEEQGGQGGASWFSSLTLPGKAVMISSGVVGVAGVSSIYFPVTFCLPDWFPETDFQKDHLLSEPPDIYKRV